MHLTITKMQCALDILCQEGGGAWTENWNLKYEKIYGKFP